MKHGDTIMIGETSRASSSSSLYWGWLWRTPSSSLSSSLGKPSSAVNSSSFGQVDEECSTARVLKYVWGWSSVASNGWVKKKLMENGTKRSWVKEDVFGSNIFCSYWDKGKVSWVAYGNYE